MQDRDMPDAEDDVEEQLARAAAAKKEKRRRLKALAVNAGDTEGESERDRDRERKERDKDRNREKEKERSLEPVQEKRVKWDRGLQTTVYLDDTPPNPKWDTKAVPSQKSCLTPAAKVCLDILYRQVLRC